MYELIFRAVENRGLIRDMDVNKFPSFLGGDRPAIFRPFENSHAMEQQEVVGIIQDVGIDNSPASKYSVYLR